MAGNSINKGNIATATATDQVVAGKPVIIGNVVGVALGNAEIGEDFVAETVGVFSLEKDGDVFGLGQKLYLDNGLLSIHKTAVFVGHCWKPALASDTHAEVRLSYFGNDQLSNVVNVESVEDFPEPIPQGEGLPDVITLESEKSYLISTFVDLNGARIVCAGVQFIGGYSSENCGLLSTGLTIDYPLLQSAFDLPIRNLDISAPWAVDVDGFGNNAAIDWKALNFTNTQKITIKDVTNFVYESSAMLNSVGLSVDGTIGTVAIETSLLQGDGSANPVIEIKPTAIIQRRFRVIFSSVIAFGSTIGIQADVAASIPIEGYIFYVVNFSGGGAYLSGVQPSDNKSRFEGCRGVANSATIAQYYMQGNATPTTGLGAGFVNIAGTTLAGPFVQRFSLSDNKATKTGALIGFHKATITATITGSANKEFAVAIGKNDVADVSSISGTTTNAAGRSEQVTAMAIVDLSQNDYITAMIDNLTDATDLTAVNLNVIIEPLN